jgi:8-oxo-dGTP pyrophosphatase MutT (NUDIX family)
MTDQRNLQVGVKALILSDSGNILFLKRNPSVYKNDKLLLDIPGGRIDSGLSLEENLKREVLEETGINTIEVLGILSAQDIFYENNHVIRLTYVSRVTGEVVVLSEEHESFEWIPLESVLSREGEVDELVVKVIKDKMSFIKDIVEKSGKTQ